MGTWGIGTFENDATADWLWDLEETDDATLLHEALELEAVDYLEAPDAELILAAAEIIHGIRNVPRDGIADEAVEWIAAHKHLDVAGLVPQAVNLIDLVLSDDSELKELWRENEEDFAAWEANVRELQANLKGG